MSDIHVEAIVEERCLLCLNNPDCKINKLKLALAGAKISSKDDIATLAKQNELESHANYIGRDGEHIIYKCLGPDNRRSLFNGSINLLIKPKRELQQEAA